MIEISTENAWMLMHVASIVEEINDVVEGYAKAAVFINKDCVPEICWYYCPE